MRHWIIIHYPVLRAIQAIRYAVSAAQQNEGVLIVK
jgi:hypothetical protein